MYMYDEKRGIPADPHDYQGKSLKEAVHPKMYTHHHVIPNLYGFLSYVNIK